MRAVIFLWIATCHF